MKNIFLKQKQKVFYFLKYKHLKSNLNEYLFFLKNNLEIKSKLKKSKSLQLKFNQCFIKKGLSLKGINIVSAAFNNFYNIFYKYQVDGLNFTKYQDFLIFSKSDSNFFKRLFLLKRIKDLLMSSFYLKIEKISKKLKKTRKISKLKYKYKICFMPQDRRVNYLFKTFLIYVNTLHYFNINVRLTEALLNTILEDKNSHLYKQKITIIKKFKN